MPQSKDLTNLMKELETNLKIHIKISIEEALTKQEQKFNSIVEKLFGQLKSQQESINSITESQEFLNKEFEEIKTNISEIQNSQTKKSSKIGEMEEKIKVLQDQLNMECQMRDDLGQYIRRENLEFHGIPVTLNEDTNHIVKQMVKKLNIELTDRDISTSHRLPAAGDRPPGIIARFTQRGIRNRIYQKRARLVGVKDFGIKGMTALYINENLTPKKRSLFSKAYKKKVELHYKYIWSMNGDIYMRKHTEGEKLRIATESDLDNLK